MGVAIEPWTRENAGMRRLAALVIVAFAAGCSGGGGGGGRSIQGTEDEPNDSPFQATDLGGAGVHEVSGNACNDDIGIDYFTATASSAGTVTLTLEWDETDIDNDDLGVALLDADEFQVSSTDTPPASITAPAVAGARVYVEVDCYGGFSAVPYSGTLTVP